MRGGIFESANPNAGHNLRMPTRLSVLGVRFPEEKVARRFILPTALGIVAGLTALEYSFRLDYSLGVLYTIPVLLASTVLARSRIIALSLFCAAARAPFTPSASDLETFLKFLMAALAYSASGLLVVEMSNNRRRLVESYARLKVEQTMRHRAEEQLRTLADSSPAAILTLSAQSEVLAANRAAHDLLGFPAGALLGQRVDAYLPTFADALKVASERPVRTSVSGWAKRRDDQIFPIQAWFSVYRDGDRRCLAAIVVDMSEDVRDRERENFRHLLDYNKLLAGAVSHEIRNLCSAISVVCSNLNARTPLGADADFDALVRLVDGLVQLASFELRHTAGQHDPRADLKSVLDHLRLVIEPDWEEIDGAVIWHVPDTLPPVSADAHGLLQIFLNLCQNSLRAVETMPERRLTVSITSASDDVVIVFKDSGPGVMHPERLFHFQPVPSEGSGSGLGLYISRELARSFGGELEHVASANGAEFRVVIPVAVASLAADFRPETQSAFQ